MDQEWVPEAEASRAGGRSGAAATFQITAEATTLPSLAQAPALIRVLPRRAGAGSTGPRIMITRKLAVRAADSCRSADG
jgi:hypothetical protein